MGSDYEILTEKDMPYFRDLVAKGQAVIIEISEDVLMSLDIGEFEEDKEAAEITDEELLEYINSHKESFIAAAERNEQILESTRVLEEELMGTEAIPEMDERYLEQERIMPVAPLPTSMEDETERRRAAVPERETESTMREEEWKKAGGPTPMEMLDEYDREQEEQDRLRERRKWNRARQERRRMQEDEREEPRERKEDTGHRAPAQEGVRKTPPTPAQLLEAKEKARRLGYEGQVPMEILMMLLDVTTEEASAPQEAVIVPDRRAVPEEDHAPARPSKVQEMPIRPRITQEEDRMEEETPDPELDNRADEEFLSEIEDSIRRNLEAEPGPMEDEPSQAEREEETAQIRDNAPEEETAEEVKTNPYTGEDAELYREIVESGQLTEEEISFVMSHQVPPDYKRQLFMRMLENKLDEYD